MLHAGRLLLSLLHVPLRHDVYVAAAGCYALWALARLVGWARSVVMSPSIAGVSEPLATFTDDEHLQQIRTSWLHPPVLHSCETHCRCCVQL